MVATPGRRLGRYHLVEPIGAGPCGEVYRAKVVGVAGMERQLAIKRFHPAVLAMPDAGAKLQSACRSYGGLDHPRVARLSELGVAGGETFTATELVPGLDVGRLRAMAQDGNDPLPSGGVLQLLSAAARAVGYAHGRGVCHWGLAPGNLIAMPDGDIKVTDFGILTCRLPARPATDETLLQRLPYLAPEQMLGEPLSAATDVFALGVLAYELVGGARPFTGDTTADLEHAIVSGRPQPLELPRPIARVIDRCLARSPFERFPDARSLADALDAALRLSPLTGTRHDVGDRVRTTLEHLVRINEQQLSGALSFSVPTPPPRPRPIANPSLPLPPPSGPPMPIAPPPPTPATSMRPIPRRPFRPSSNPPLTVPPTNPGDEITQARPRPRVETDLSVGDDTGVRIEPLWPPTERVPLVRADGSPITGPPIAASMTSPFDGPRTVPPSDRAVAVSQPPPFASRRGPPTEPPPMSGPPLPTGFTPLGAPPPPMAMQIPTPPRRRNGAIAALALVVIGGAVGATYLLTRTHGTPASAGTATDGGAIAVADPPVDAAPAPRDARTAAAKPRDAAVPIDAAPPIDGPTPTATAATDKLTITSTPSGARVYLDGADQGATPLTINGSTDDYKIAVVLPGHALHLATIPGAGAYEAKLEPAPAHTGKGGIKVRCRDKHRYYVFIDGVATGELCPTERVPVDLGVHSVEIYDLTTETRRTLPPLHVVQMSRSTRIRAD